MMGNLHNDAAHVGIGSAAFIAAVKKPAVGVSITLTFLGYQGIEYIAKRDKLRRADRRRRDGKLPPITDVAYHEVKQFGWGFGIAAAAWLGYKAYEWKRRRDYARLGEGYGGQRAPSQADSDSGDDWFGDWADYRPDNRSEA